MHYVAAKLRNESFSECVISFIGTNLIAVGIKSSMHRQQVCSVPGSIEALTREIERDPKMSHKENIWTMPQMRWLHKWHQFRANKDNKDEA
ncbi:hypothetical protein P8452_08286 [Trifolium repens]|nr:hypothetical protein P8452_08286 [Trifolium repens]